jgi:hypothetical protein
LATFNKNKKFNSDSLYGINVREYRRGNQKWKIQRNWQQCTQSEGKTKHIITQYVLDTTTHKETQIA